MGGYCRRRNSPGSTLAKRLIVKEYTYLFTFNYNRKRELFQAPELATFFNYR